MLRIKDEYLGKRVGMAGSKGQSLDLVLSNELPQEAIKEVQLKWAHWVYEEQPKAKPTKKAKAKKEIEKPTTEEAAPKEEKRGS